MRVLLLLDVEAVITSLLFVLNPKGEVSGFARLRIVDWCDHPADAPAPNDYNFPGDLRDSDLDDDPSDSNSRLGRFSPAWSGPLARMGCRACPVFLSFRPRDGGSSTGGGGRGCQALGVPLFPSVPLWSFASGAVFALSLAGVPRVVIQDLLTPVRPRTPPPPPAPSLVSEVEEEPSSGLRERSTLPSLSDLLAKEEHKLTVRRRRVRRRRAAESVFKVRRSRRLTAKEDPLFTDATTKVTHVKATQLDLSKASEHMKKALEESAILVRPPPARVPSARLRCLGCICGLSHLFDVEDDVF